MYKYVQTYLQTALSPVVSESPSSDAAMPVVVGAPDTSLATRLVPEDAVSAVGLVGGLEAVALMEVRCIATTLAVCLTAPMSTTGS
jgi:hypothetical protein